MTKPTFLLETSLWNKGYEYILGLDEVGRGAFAGPLVAAGVIFSPCHLERVMRVERSILIDDSKKLSPPQREISAKWIKENALFWAIESINVKFINKLGIGKANRAVFRKVIKSLLYQLQNDSNHFILIDGFYTKYLPGGIKKQKAIIKGDQKSVSIASASIIAKVYRDNLMIKLHDEYPLYNFFNNKGYGTKFHRDAIRRHGLSKIHRTSFNLSKFLPLDKVSTTV